MKELNNKIILRETFKWCKQAHGLMSREKLIKKINLHLIYFTSMIQHAGVLYINLSQLCRDLYTETGVWAYKTKGLTTFSRKILCTKA